jgi:pimeloyl-ACP methyl ester carboxylesterase
VLLVAGLGGRGEFRPADVTALARVFRVITHDHRGTGGSTLSPGPYSVARLADDVLRPMDALGVERADFVGHSTRGAIRPHLALRAPQRLHRLVLSRTWCRPDDLRDAVGGIALPTRVLGSADDGLTPAHVQRELAARVPGARLHVFPSGEHFFPYGRADEFANLLLDLLTEADDEPSHT